MSVTFDGLREDADGTKRIVRLPNRPEDDIEDRKSVV